MYITCFSPLCYRAKRVTIHGTIYKVGATLHIGYNDELLLFWQVVKNAVSNEYVQEVMFIVSGKETLNFNKNFQCYQIANPFNPVIKVAYAKDFSCYLPLNQCKPFRACTHSRFIFVRYDLEADA